MVQSFALVEVVSKEVGLLPRRVGFILCRDFFPAREEVIPLLLAKLVAAPPYPTPCPVSRTGDKPETATGISSDPVGFVETHGTGTALGDPIEVGIGQSLRTPASQGMREAVWYTVICFVAVSPLNLLFLETVYSFVCLFFSFFSRPSSRLDNSNCSEPRQFVFGTFNMWTFSWQAATDEHEKSPWFGEQEITQFYRMQLVFPNSYTQDILVRNLDLSQETPGLFF